jgi:LmbE family N-acetylglucosaminyl deacetylase
MTSALIVVAHPDDEILGCGGTAAALIERGVRVQSCILCAGAEARGGHPGRAELLEHCCSASRRLGMEAPILGDFPNLGLGTVAHGQLTAFIESAMLGSGASIVFTHHPADLNDDHLHVSRACQAAARLGHRRPGTMVLDGLYFMEVMSSTDWAFPGAMPPFSATTFVRLDAAHMRAKREALACYRGIMRPFPHSRSDEAIDALAAIRGAQCNASHAEAFQAAFATIDPSRLAP